MVEIDCTIEIDSVAFVEHCTLHAGGMTV